MSSHVIHAIFSSLQMFLGLEKSSMNITRRSFHYGLGMTALCGIHSDSSMQARIPGQQETQSIKASSSHYLFQDRTFENVFLASLGRADFQSERV